MTIRAQDRPVWTAIALIPVLFCAIAFVQQRIEAKASSAASREELLLRSGRAVKDLSLGYESLLADIYWTRAVQYYGSRIGASRSSFDSLWPLLDIATTLDPHLIPAYRFGAIFLSESWPAGAGQPELAIELVKRGIAANPNDWQLGTDLGFLYYWRMKDYANAAAAYQQASKNPDSPVWVKYMAARIAQKGGSLETSRMIWSQLYESTKDFNIKKNAAKQLQSLKAQEDEEHLDQLAQQYRERLGRYPASIQAMVDVRLLPGSPVDPAGFPYVLGPDGKSRLNSASPLVANPSH